MLKRGSEEKLQQLFRKNDYEKVKNSHSSLSKNLSLFQSAEQAVLTPGSCSFGPYLKQSKQSNKSLYYLAPHNLIEYFASEILLRIGILTPKCRILSWQDEGGALIPYDIVMISVDEDEEIDNSKLYAIASSKGYRPILIKQGKQILLYGTPNASHWQITTLQSEVFSKLEFRKPGDYPYIMSNKIVTPDMYKEIASKKAHMLPVIASKNIDEFIPIDLVRRYNRSGSKLDQRYFSHLNGRQRELYARYELDIVNQVIYDHVENKPYKISGNLFGSDIAALLICDYDFQSDGSNFGFVKMGNRFYAAAIDKEAARFEGKKYDVLAGELSDRVINDYMYKTRMDEQIIAVVYQISKALITDKNNQCDFDRIFTNSRVQDTHQLFILPDNRCANVKKTASSIVEHYQKIYGDNFLEMFSEREELRRQIACHVMENIDASDSLHSYDIIKNTIIEDLRGPYYRGLLSDQTTKIINNDDLNNVKLFNTIVADIVGEHDFLIANSCMKRFSNK